MTIIHRYQCSCSTAPSDLWAIIAYLEHGVRPISNEVEDTDRPPEGWAGEYTAEKVGSYPATSFPTANEVGAKAPGER